MVSCGKMSVYTHSLFEMAAGGSSVTECEDYSDAYSLTRLLLDGKFDEFVTRKDELSRFESRWFFRLVQQLSDDDVDESTTAETAVHFLLDFDSKLALSIIDWSYAECKQDAFLWALKDDCLSVACAIVTNPNSNLSITKAYFEPILIRAAEVTEVKTYERPTTTTTTTRDYLSYIYSWLVLNTPESLMEQLEQCVLKKAPRTIAIFNELKSKRTT